MTVLTKKTYHIRGKFPSGYPVDVRLVHYSKGLAMRSFLNLFCRSKR